MIHACGDMMLVGAATDEERHRAGRGVLCREAVEHALDLDLALAERKIRQRRQAFVRWYPGEQIVDAGNADAGEHLAAVLRREREIAHDEYRSNGTRIGLEPVRIAMRTTSNLAQRPRTSQNSRCSIRHGRDDAAHRAVLTRAACPRQIRSRD